MEILLRQSRGYNEKHDITGLLMAREGIFVQFLEGPKEEVKMLYKRIEKDVRHSTLIQIYEDEISARLFGEWAMFYRRVHFPIMIGDEMEGDTDEIILLFEHILNHDNHAALDPNKLRMILTYTDLMSKM